MSRLTRKKRIALFGGSFNPPHEGHLEIIRRVAKRKTIDEVWILPVWRHPMGKRLPSFEKRISRCRTFFTRVITPPRPPSYLKRGELKKIKVKTYEKRKGATGWTIDLVTFLQKKFSTYKFSWVMGSDAYRQRRKWKQFSELQKRVRLIVFSRGAKSPIPDVSSSKIRRRK